MKTIILLLLTSSLLSCTITKRTFRSGYHVEWNHKFRQATALKQPQPPTKEALSSLSDKPNDQPASDESVSSVTPENPRVMVEATAVESAVYPNPLVSDNSVISATHDTVKTISDSSKDQLVDHQRKTVEPVSWVALFFSLSNSALRILIFLQIVDSFFLPLAAIFFVLTIVLAIVSLVRYKKYKPKYYRPWLALAAIWIETFVWVMIAFIIALQAIGNMLGNGIAAFFHGMN